MSQTEQKLEENKQEHQESKQENEQQQEQQQQDAQEENRQPQNQEQDDPLQGNGEDQQRFQTTDMRKDYEDSPRINNNQQNRPMTTGSRVRGQHQLAQSATQPYGLIQQDERRDFIISEGKPIGQAVRTYSAKNYKNPNVKSHSRLLTAQSRNQHSAKSANFFSSGKATPKQGGDFVRLKPQQIAMDKERLYEDILHLKQENNKLKQENMQLRTRNNNLEREASKFEKMISEVAASATAKKGSHVQDKAYENHLTLALKQQLKEVRGLLKSREEELGEIKKTLKYTKVQELEIQLKIFTEESQRLKAVLDHLLKDNTDLNIDEEERMKMHEDYVNQIEQSQKLKKENQEMTTALKILEEQNFEYEKKVSEQEKKYKRELHTLKKSIHDSEREINRLKTQLYGTNKGGFRDSAKGGQQAGFNHAEQQNTDLLKEELQRKESQNAELLNQLGSKENQILILERQIREMKIEYNEKMSRAATSERTEITTRRAQIQPPVIKEPSSKDSSVRGNSKVQILSPGDYSKRVNFSTDGDAGSKQKSLTGLDENKKSRKRVRKVRAEDLEEIAFELNLRLRVKKLSFEKVDEMMWVEKFNRSKMISIRDMQELLKQEPLCMRRPNEILLLSRYLIEENNEEYLYFDENCQNHVSVVKSIIKTILGPIIIYDKEKANRIHDEIMEMLHDKLDNLHQNLQAICKSEYITRKNLHEGFKYINVEPNEEQVNYMLTRLFEISDDIEKLPLDKITEIFSTRLKANNEDFEQSEINQNAFTDFQKMSDKKDENQTQSDDESIQGQQEKYQEKEKENPLKEEDEDYSDDYEEDAK